MKCYYFFILFFNLVIRLHWWRASSYSDTFKSFIFESVKSKRAKIKIVSKGVRMIAIVIQPDSQNWVEVLAVVRPPHQYLDPLLDPAQCSPLN